MIADMSPQTTVEHISMMILASGFIMLLTHIIAM